MTLKQVGVAVAVAVAGVAVAAMFGFLNLLDRRFAEMRDEIRDIRTEMRAGFDRVDTRLDALTADVRKLTADVHMLVGRQQERDHAPSDD